MTRADVARARAVTMSAWSRFFDEERDGYVLGLLRVALASLLLANTARLIVEFGRRGYFGNFFHMPLVPGAWLPSPPGYACILGMQVLAELAALLGVWSRAGLFIAASSGLYLLTLDRLQYHNNRYALLLFALLLAFSRCDRSFLVLRRPRERPSNERRSPDYARCLLRIQISLVYLGSTLGKLWDADWRGGQVLGRRFATTHDYWAERGVELPGLIVTLVSSPWFASLAAKAAIGTELFLALGLWGWRTRRLALWVGLIFHISIELFARVELFSYTMLASYLAFVVPEVRERRFEFDPRDARACRLARAVLALDWCARFQITERTLAESARSSPPGDDSPFSVTARDGHPRHGARGLLYLAEALPALFPLWLPLWLVSRGLRETYRPKH